MTQTAPTDKPASAPSASASLTQHQVTVLLIDDQAIIGEAVRRMLKDQPDIVFHFCSDPSKAIDAAVQLQPTVILQDLVMPGVDGLTLVKFFRAHPATREIPLIVLSTKEEATIKAEAFALGANDYLVKLPDRVELIARMRYHSKGYINLLERNEAHQRLLESQQQLAEEVSQAARYVESLLPQPMNGGIAIDWRFLPSAQLGGDSFGYHWLDDDHLGIYLLDVCGHGVGAALLSVSAMNVLRSQALPNTDFRNPSQVLAALNETFPMEKQNDMYFTIWYGVYRKSSSELVYSGGGHPPALLGRRSSSGELELKELRAGGPIIGAMSGMDYDSSRCTIVPGDLVWVYSDGVYEIHKAQGGMWRYQDFLKFMAAANGHPQVMDQLLDNDRTLGGRDILDDDFSMLQVRF